MRDGTAMNESTVKISICIPAYNNVSEVERLLASISSQDFKNFEVCLSDDSTNDEIAHLVAHRYPFVRYVHNTKPLGHIFNWNAAIRMATGEYIKIMFSDDWFTDKKSLERFVGLLDDHPEVSLAFSGSRQVALENGTESYDRCASEEFIEMLSEDYRMLFRGNQIGTPSATIYRRGEMPVLFDEQSNWASDMFLYFELLQKNPRFAYTKEPLVSVGVHENQYTESFAEKDMRIYNDYRYMYTKYSLSGSDSCREYFTERFIMKYHMGCREAKALGIDSSMYWKKWLAERRETVRCFVHARCGK